MRSEMDKVEFRDATISRIVHGGTTLHIRVVNAWLYDTDGTEHQVLASVKLGGISSTLRDGLPVRTLCLEDDSSGSLDLQAENNALRCVVQGFGHEAR